MCHAIKRTNRKSQASLTSEQTMIQSSLNAILLQFNHCRFRCSNVNKRRKKRALKLRASPNPDKSNLLLFKAGLILLSLFIYISPFQVRAKSSNNESVTITTSGDSNNKRLQQPQQFNLDCLAGEQRFFNYESATKIWGSANQQIRLRASLRIRCLEPPTDSVLKYLAEVLSVSPSFGLSQSGASVAASSAASTPSSARSSKSTSSTRWFHSGRQLVYSEYEQQFGRSQPVAQSEPVLEEVGEAIGEAANRVKRSVSGWLSKTWSSVKDFLVNIFSSSERSSVNRDQVFSESGIDIGSQCKSSNGKQPSIPNGLPIDDSLFDDLEPKYYIGASLNPPPGATAYEFDDHHEGRTVGRSSASGDDEDDEANLSFFDDPKPRQSPPNHRAKRASSTHARQSRTIQPDEYERLLRLPFVFVQARTGKILEIRFSEDDVDTSIKNFKRHLCDLFATNLDTNKTQTNEVSPIGKHPTKYLIDLSSNSSIIRQSLVKQSIMSNNKDEQESAKQLVRVLAMVGMQSGGSGPQATTDPNNNKADGPPLVGSVGSVESRDPNKPATGSQGDNSLSVLRSINSTSNIKLNSRTVSPEIEQIQVRVRQVQQISEGRLTGSAGQLGMSLIQGTRSDWAGGGGGNKSSARVKRGAPDESPSPGKQNPELIEDIAELLQVSTSFSVQLVPAGRLGDFADMTFGHEGEDKEDDEDDDRQRYNHGDVSSRLPARVRRSTDSVGSEEIPADKEAMVERARKKASDQANSKETDNGSSVAASSVASANQAGNDVASSARLVSGEQQPAEQQRQKQVGKQQAANKSNQSDVGAANSSLSPGKQQPQVKQPAAAATTKVPPREPLVTRPTDSQELQRVISEWKQLELSLQFSSSNLLTESSQGPAEGQAQRLELLRDQIQMRLNEELLRNRSLRRSTAAASGANGGDARKASAPSEPAASTSAGVPSSTQAQAQRNDLGLSLTQLILDSGITGKRKGSVYSTLEEIIDLELSLGEDSQEGAVSRLLRETVRVDKLRQHCKSAIASLEDIRVQSARIVLRSPFNVDSDSEAESGAEAEAEAGDYGESSSSMMLEQPGEGESTRRPAKLLSQVIGKLQVNNGRRLERCKQVVQLMLRVSERQVADLVLELIDECNKRMLAGVKDEELGHGPTSRYYRSLRQQFTELLGNVNRPSEALLDKLVERLRYTRLAPLLADGEPTSANNNNNKAHKNTGQGANPQQEFTYVNKVSVDSSSLSPSSSRRGSSSWPRSSSFNRSLLREEDDFNNNDADGSLLMTITSLAAKPSIGRAKRAQVAEKLLFTLKASSCALFDGPDLDVLESMGNFLEPLDEIVGKVVHLARRCKHQDQYLVACVHALQGQLHHNTTRRFLADQLRSKNASCTLKSEIVLTLLGAILVDNFKQQQQSTTPPAGNAWPAFGLNQVDQVLLELVDEKRPSRAPDRKCLGQLVGHYMSKKGAVATNAGQTTTPPLAPSTRSSGQVLSGRRGGRAPSQSGAGRTRLRRAVHNESNFWDEVQCKRWALQDQPEGNNNTLQSAFSLAGDLGATGSGMNDDDNIDDNSILVAVANSRLIGRSGRNRPAPAATSRRTMSQRLLEKEAEDSGGSSTSSQQAAAGSPVDGSVRRRHKCSASKKFGPKNAEAVLKAEVVNDLVGAKDENKFLARFRLATNFLGNRIDVGRMYLWHQKRMTRAHVNILGKSLWDTSHSCHDKAPHHLLYMPLFDFNLWLVKVSVGIRLHSEMGFFSNCDSRQRRQLQTDDTQAIDSSAKTADDQLELYPTIKVRASGEASAKFVFARAGMSLASNYGYQGNIRVSRQPESCMSIYSAHQPMNITFSSWFQLWDNDCHFWGSRNKAGPQATKWRLAARRPTAWLEDECLVGQELGGNSSHLPVGSSSPTAAPSSSSTSHWLVK